MAAFLQSMGRKFATALVASCFALFGFWLGLSVEQVAVVISPLLMSIGAQGLSDFGKEKAIVARAESQDRIDAGVPPPAVVTIVAPQQTAATAPQKP